jgi:hypothetical protein
MFSGIVKTFRCGGQNINEYKQGIIFHSPEKKLYCINIYTLNTWIKGVSDEKRFYAD